jgi:hypothetical protein
MWPSGLIRLETDPRDTKERFHFLTAASGFGTTMDTEVRERRRVPLQADHTEYIRRPCMKRVAKFAVPVIALAAFGFAANLLFAQHGGGPQQSAKEIVKVLTDNKMTLIKAIQAAEDHSKGQAFAAMTRIEGDDAMVNVSCLVGEETKHLVVDVKTGKVTEKAPKEKPEAGKGEPPKKKP